MNIETVKSRLKFLGYECVKDDDFAITFVMSKVEQHIKHCCNIDDVPDCLEFVFVDMVCGDFLQTKKATGQLTSIEIEPIVKRIQDGDTTVETNATVDSELVFNTFIDKLINGHQEDLLAHRRLKW